MTNGHQNQQGQGHYHHGNGHGHGHAGDYCPPPCFGGGTKLMGPKGWLRVEEIKAGDLVATTEGPKAVLWAGMSWEEDETYIVFNTASGKGTVMTKNHGVCVKTLSGKRMLSPVKFLVDSFYGDFHVSEFSRERTPVYHIMFDTHTLVTSTGNILSESYFCGGYSTDQEALAAYHAETGCDAMPLALPRLKRNDADDVLEIVST